MNLETKVGFFVLLGLAILGVSIMQLSDLRLERRNTLYFVFDDIQGLNDKSQVRIAGVEVGQVEKVELVEGRAKITSKIKKDVPVYANAKVSVKLIGLIGSQFLDLNPGTPEAPLLKDGDTIYGAKSKSLSDLIEKLDELIGGKDGKGGIGNDLKATMANLRSVTESLNYGIGMQREEVRGIVQNLHEFTGDLKGVAADIHEITESKKADIQMAIEKLRSVLERTDEVLAKVQRGEGSIGKLLADKEMGEEVKKTVSNLKDTSESAKEVLGRFTKIRSFWEFQMRAVPAADSFRVDGGIRLQPRDHKYYYLGVSNAGDRKDEFKNEGDYEEKTTINAVLGKDFGPVTVEVGAIRSAGGVGLRYYPFKPWVERKRVNLALEDVELNAYAFDFGRDEIRGRLGRERQLKGPQYNVGFKYGLTRWLKVGANVEDITEVRQYNVATHLVFEDRDLAYLFGFVSFAR